MDIFYGIGDFIFMVYLGKGGGVKRERKEANKAQRYKVKININLEFCSIDPLK